MNNAPIRDPLFLNKDGVLDMKSIINVRTWVQWFQNLVNSIAPNYGSMYVYNLGTGFTVTISAPDSFVLISNAQVQGGTCSGFTFQNNQELKCLSAGIYLAVWSISFESASNNQEAEGAIGINANVQTQTASHALIANASKPQVITGNGILTLAANDLVRMYINNHTGATNLIIDHLTLSLTRISQ